MIKLLKTRNIVLLFLLLLFSLTPAVALDIKKYEELKKTSRENLKIHINGVGDGYSWSNSILAQRGSQPFYCPPPKIALNAENFIDIIDKQITKREKTGKVEPPVELILFFGLVESFPCAK